MLYTLGKVHEAYASMKEVIHTGQGLQFLVLLHPGLDQVLVGECALYTQENGAISYTTNETTSKFRIRPASIPKARSTFGHRARIRCQRLLYRLSICTGAWRSSPLSWKRFGKGIINNLEISKSSSVWAVCKVTICMLTLEGVLLLG